MVTVNLPDQLAATLFVDAERTGETIETILVRKLSAVNDRRGVEASYYRQLKKRLQDKRGNQCEKCGSKKRIVLHRKHMRNNLAESEDDLLLLCHECKDSFVRRSKSGDLTIDDIPLIDPVGFGWLIEQIKKQHASQEKFNQIDFDEVDRKNWTFEVNWAAKLKAAMEAAGATQLTAVEACNLIEDPHSEFVEALLWAIKERHGWSAEPLPEHREAASKLRAGYRLNLSCYTFRPPSEG